MAKRTRIDSAKGSTDIMKDALSGAPKPPAGVNISAAVFPFWEIVTTAKLLSAHLQIHTEATQGKSREQVEQNKAHRGAQEFADKPEADDLIPRPTH
jgi:hypothetical protein